MSRRCIRWLFAGLLVLASAISAYATEVSPSPELVRIPGHKLSALVEATALPSMRQNEGQPITVTIVLKRDKQPEFERYLKDLYDPRSKVFHKFLTQSEIASRFGPSQRVYDQTLDYMRANGFALVRGSKNRLTLTLSSTRVKAERLFHIRIQEYRAKDRNFFANDADPAMPAELAAHIQTVAGLSNLAQPRPGTEAIKNALGPVICSLGALACVEISEQSRNNVYNKCLTAVRSMQAGNLAGLVDFAKLLCAEQGPGTDLAPGLESSADAISSVASTFNGAGQKIGLLEFDTFQRSDVSDFLNLIGASATQINQLSEVKVGGGATAGPNQSEVLLDIDTAMTIATGANVIVYDAPFNGRGSFQALFNQMVGDGVTVISNSWAYCEDQTTLADVEGIDTIFQTAEAGGVSIFNGSGDTGSTCLDGAANTVAVPADSPNATAVGGSSLDTGPGFTYLSETWWDGTHDSPPTGQGGFGVSKFFGVPTYQNGLAIGGRSVPDVVANADPAKGVMICEASAGGCPSGLLYGGTSYAAPEWAGFVALLNQALGSNLGNLNTQMYAKSGAFHNAASMGSDFAHVGLGSPNVDALFLALSGNTAGAADAGVSTVTPYVGVQSPYVVSGPAGVLADGTTTGNIVVKLLDANGNSVSGKTVSLSAQNGSPTITPPSVITDSSGQAVFSLKDATIETPTITATDTSDGLQLTSKPMFPFVALPAAGGSINATPASVLNDGMATTTITVTLLDKNGHGTEGKLVNIQQNGNSIITGPTPQVTDSNGNIAFTATDIASETVTYTAVDVSDGNLPVPGSTPVNFSGDPSAGCVVGTPLAAPGFIITPYATGFPAANLGVFSNINLGCGGVAGIAFDSSGNLYANDEVDGNIYKFPPGGGVAGAGTQLNASSIGEGLTGLVFDSSGNLFASRIATGGNFNTGVVLQIDPSDGSVMRTISSGLTCSTVISIDPLSQDLFTDDGCSGAGSDDPSVFRISDPSGVSPTKSLYATLTGTPNTTLAFAPGGTIYVWAFSGGVPKITEVSGTNGPATPTVSPLGAPQLAALGMLAGGTGAGTFVIANPFVSGQTIGINNVDLTQSPPSISTSFVQKVGANFMVFGPDGCIYTSQLNTVFKITDTSGGCTYAPKLASPTLALSPVSVSPNPAQGTSQTFNASLHNASPLAGRQVVFSIDGANAQTAAVQTDANGLAPFSYVAALPGQDTITAATVVGVNTITSNEAVVTWGSGSHTTFLSLNQSPKGGAPGQMVNLIATLTDVSAKPATPISGQTVDFSVDGQDCNAPTNAQGMATCQITVSGSGLETESASFAGAANLLPSNASEGFNVVTEATPTATPTATRTATPTATPTPVAGKLKVSPKTLNFGSVDVGSQKTRFVTVKNAGKIKKKKVPLPILIEMESGVSNPFSITQACIDDDLGPKGKGIAAGSCKISVTFTPTAAQKYNGTLMIDTNLEPTFETSVKLEGAGKVPKH